MDRIVIELNEVTKVFSDGGQPQTYSQIAVNRVSFCVYRGECLGIMGRNGSGKTTLLKMLAGTVKPSSGDICISGKLLAITEVGSGLLPDLSGRENVTLQSRLYGMSVSETENIVPLVHAFSEIGEAFDAPVKTYSQGMFLRLAFAAMIHLPVEVVLLDEILAVGDVMFRVKCFQKLRELSGRGLTVIIVSHAYEEIAAFCNRCIIMENGRILAQGSAEFAYGKYLRAVGGERNFISSCYQLNTIRQGHVNISEVTIGKDGEVSVNSPIEVVILYEKLIPEDLVGFHLSISNSMGTPVLDTASYYGRTIGTQRSEFMGKTGKFVQKCLVPAYMLNTGIYNLGLTVTIANSMDDWTIAVETVRGVGFIISEADEQSKRSGWTFSSAPVRMAAEWCGRRIG